MALITGRVVFAASATIFAADQNLNDGTIWNEFNGLISNPNISSSAAIAYSKLALTGSIVNADIASGAAIAASKLNLVSPSGIGTTTPAAGKFTTLEATSTLKLGTTHQGDVLYDNGTSLIRLTPGTSGQFLKTQGTAANPIWADIIPKTILILNKVIGTTTATQYTSFGAQDISTTDNHDIPIPLAGTLKKLYVYTANTSPDTIVVTVRKNNVDTALTATVASTGTAANNTADSFTVVAGDLISVSITSLRSIALGLGIACELDT